MLLCYYILYMLNQCITFSHFHTYCLLNQSIMLAYFNTYCIVDECCMLPSLYAYYNLHNIKYVFYRNTGFYPSIYNTSATQSCIMCVCVCVCVCGLPLVLVESCCSILSFLCSVLFIIVCLFWHFAVDWSLYCLFFNLWLLIPPLYIQACLINVFYFSLLFQVLHPHPDDTPTLGKSIFWIAVAIIITLLAILLMKIT
jgi:hypothetical protein